MVGFEVVESWDGLKWAIGRGEGHKEDVEALGKSEFSVLRALRSVASKDMVFCDVGAFVGYYSVRLAPRVREVHAFEPNPVSRGTLLKNVELNGLSNVKVYPYALSDKSGVGKLHLMASGSTLLEGYGGWGCVEVEVKAMDEVLDWVDLVKVDVEGYEWRVVQGMMGLIRRCKPFMVIEHHDFRHYRVNTYGLIKDALKREGYKMVYLTDPHRFYWHGSRPVGDVKFLLVNHWVNHCVKNLMEGRPWYHGLPYEWWWGMSLVDFIYELPEHVEGEELWVKLLE
ncbi:MAG: FkbM family methyltransferase [Candidatus Bathyarchaeia archaeon]